MTAVLFDLDGTLIDSLQTVTSAANHVLGLRSLDPVPPAVVAGFVGLGEQVFVDRLIAATALEVTDRPGIMTDFMARYKVEARETEVFPGVHAALDELAAAGYRLGLVTNKPRAPLVPTLKAAGLDHRFEVIVAGDDLPRRKPDPLPIRHVLGEMAETACLYVGDSPVDAATAQAAEVPFVLFTEGIRVAEVSEIAHRVAFDDFSALPAVIAEIAPV